MVWNLMGAPIRGRWIDSQELDGDLSKIECEDMSQDGGTTFRPGTECPLRGRRLKTEHVPTKLEWRSKMPVSDYKTPMGLSMVSERFKEVVEELEPDVHQFLPLEVVDGKGNHLSNHWYFIPCNRIDSVDENATTMILYKGGWSNPKDFVRRGEEQYLPSDYDPEKKIELVFSEEKSAGYHFWRDKRVRFGPDLFLSDHAAETLQRENFTGLRLKKEESV